METNKYNPQHDHSLAFNVLTQLNLMPLSSILKVNYPKETDQFIEQLNLLNATNRGNEVESLLELIQLFQKVFDQKNLSLPLNEKKYVEDFFRRQLETFYELSYNVRYHQVTVQSTTDAFTLNHTSYLIMALDVLIEELTPNLSLKETSKHSPTQAPVYVEKIPYQLIKKELALAGEIKNFCEMIRSQIGNPEALPRGLLITFMWQLHQAQRNFEEIYQEMNVPQRRLIALVCSSIAQINNHYPDISKAVEVLHEAIAIHQQPKP